MKPRIIGPLGAEPITVEQARAHIEAQPYEDSDVDPIDDMMLSIWIAAAREHCESFLGLSLSSRTLEIALDAFPVVHGTSRDRTVQSRLGIDLPMGPVVAVEAIAWSDESDGELDAADFVLDAYATPARVVPVAPGWPVVPTATNAIKIRYLAGYGEESDGFAPVPAAVRAAMLLVIGHLYANREDNVDVAISSLPLNAEAFLRPLRVRLGMA